MSRSYPMHLFFSLIQGDRRLLLAAVAALLLQPLLPGRAIAQAVDPTRWMTELAEEAANAGLPSSALDQTLAEFIFPGTHVSGSYGIPDWELSDPFNAPPLACDKCVPDGNETILETPGLDVMIGYLLVPLAKTQNLTIREQLDAGARAFDLRFFRATASDASRSPELIAGRYYIHRTFAGIPQHGEIFFQIREFLDVADNEKEIIILNFSDMYEGNVEMSTASLQTFFSDLFAVIDEAQFAPESVGHGATLSSLAEAGTQVIVTYNGTTPINDAFTNSVVWAPIHTRFFGSPDVNTDHAGYPRADTWKDERELFNWLRTLSDQRPDDNAMYQMYANMGVDNGQKFPDMTSRAMLCNIIPIYDALSSVIDPIVMISNWLDKPPADPDIETDYWDEFKTAAKNAIKNAVLESIAKAALEALLDEAGVCPAINDDWDRFVSLEEVAAFTNPKILPSLVGLLRKNVNIVLADYYPSAFTAEAKRLNQGAARLSVIINDVGELECHDCFPPNGPSAPDYFPEIAYWPNGNQSPPGNWHAWPLYPNEHDVLDPEHRSHWGGPWQETVPSYRHINPNWLSVRSVSPDTPFIDFYIQIFDQDNNNCFAPFWCGTDDRSQIDGGSRQKGVHQVIWDVPESGLPVVLKDNFRSHTAGETGFFEFDSSQMTFTVDVCQWSLIPSQPEPPPEDLCGIAGFLGNNPPFAEISFSIEPTVMVEGTFQRFSGRRSEDFDPDVNGDGDPIGALVNWEWDCNYPGTPEEFVPNRDCAHYERLQELTVSDGLQFSNFSFFATDGPANRVLALRVTDAGGLSDIDTRPYEVTNHIPINAGSNIVQQGAGSTVVTAIATFFDQGLDEFPFTCEWSEGDATWPGVVEDLGRIYTSETSMLGQYSCTGTFGLAFGSHTLQFAATDKDAATGTPSETMIDVLPQASVVSLAEALDSLDIYSVESEPFPPLAPYPFIGVFGTNHNGEYTDMALSGPTLELEVSDLGASVTGPGYISFWWMIAGDEFDEIKFYMNGAQQISIFEKNVWRQFGVNIPAGEVTLDWQYKDGYLGAGNGSGVIDEVVFTPASVIDLSNTIFPTGVEGEPYPLRAITQTGGVAPTAFEITAGALPEGMTMSVVGLVSGTPTEPGDFNFQVTATDGLGYTGARSYEITVLAQLISSSGFEALVVSPEPGWDYSGGEEDSSRVASTIAVEFTPTQDILLDALGFYERTVAPNVEAPMAIWRVSDQQMLASVVIPAETGGTIIGDYRYIDLDTPLVLDKDIAYRIGGWYPEGANPRLWNGVLTLHPVLSGGDRYYHESETPLTYPIFLYAPMGPGPNMLFRPIDP